MNTISRFLELHNQGYINAWAYIPFMILTLIIGLTFGIIVLVISTGMLSNLTNNKNVIGIGSIVAVLVLSSSIMLKVTYFMNITTMNKDIEIIENRQSIVKEVNSRINDGYRVSINIGEGLTEVLDYECTYKDTREYNFIIDDTNKIIEIHKQ